MYLEMMYVYLYLYVYSMDWTALKNKEVAAPYTPPMKNSLDSSNFEQYEEADEIPHYDGNQEPFANF